MDTHQPASSSLRPDSKRLGTAALTLVFFVLIQPTTKEPEQIEETKVFSQPAETTQAVPAPMEFEIPETAAPPLPSAADGPVVVIDPGHGGADPGSHGKIGKQPVYEAPYVYDVALRLAQAIQTQGGVALLTRETPGIDRPIEASPSSLLPLQRKDVFRENGLQVRAGTLGIEQRLATVRSAMAAYPEKEVLYVSIHFDAQSPKFRGVSIVVPESNDPALAQRLISGFGEAKRLRERLDKGVWQQYNPIVSSAIRNLYVMRADKNPAQERVLVELGNFGNQADVWRIRNPAIRQEYAEIMAKAIMSGPP